MNLFQGGEKSSRSGDCLKRLIKGGEKIHDYLIGTADRERKLAKEKFLSYETV